MNNTQNTTRKETFNIMVKFVCSSKSTSKRKVYDTVKRKKTVNDIDRNRMRMRMRKSKKLPASNVKKYKSSD